MEPSDVLRRHRVLLAAICVTILLAPNIAAAAPALKLTVQDAPVARDTHPATSFAPIAKRVSPNVVNIFTTRKARAFPRLDPDSPAAAAGLQPGDVIVEANRKSVTNARQAIRAMGEVTSDRVLLRVWNAVRCIT